MRFKTKLFIQKARILVLKTLLFFILVLLAYLIIADMFASKSIAIENPVEETVVEVITAEPVDNSDKGIIQRVANEEGIDWKILWGIYQKETRGNCNSVGDKHLRNPSYGCFQINVGYHPEITFELASDLEWSARWTAQRLKRFENMGEFEMIRSHNGLVKDMSNAWYVEDVYQIIASL